MLLSGTDRVKVDGSGNVAINTTTPFSDAKLTIGNGGSGDATIALRRTASGQNDWGITNTGGNLIFKGGDATTVAGLTEYFRFRDSGGLTFNGDSAAANALDDYEEGTWTPTIRENGNGTAWDTINANNGYYTKIGDCVTFSATFNYSGVATNVNNGFYGWLAGFPFASSSSKKSGQFFISFLYSGVRTALYSVTFIHGNPYAGVYKDQDATSPGTMITGEYPTGAATVQFQGHYYV